LRFQKFDDWIPGIGEPSGLAFGKPKDRLRDTVFDGYAQE